MSLSDLPRRMKAAIIFVLAALLAVGPLASGAAHAAFASTEGGGLTVGVFTAGHGLAQTGVDSHPSELASSAETGQHRHVPSEEPGTSLSAHCDFMCHGLLVAGRMDANARLVVVSKLSPPHERGAATTAAGRIDRPPSRTASN